MIEAINALAELERLGWKYEPISESEIRLVCPAHDDDSPSCLLNTAKNLWNCKACGAKGDIVSFIAFAMSVERKTVLVDLRARYDLEEVKTIDPASAEKYHSKIFEAGPLLKALRDRGITDEMIRTARLGFNRGRITIPVYDAQHRLVNIRRYLPGAPTENKMSNARGFGKLRLYREADLAFDTVWLCGGEMKALVTGELLKADGVGAVSPTGGEGSWDDEWLPKFKGKAVVICMDVDKAGVNAAKKYAMKLVGIAASVAVVTLPVDKAKGDINDYIAAGGDIRALEPVPFEVDVQIQQIKGERDVKLSTATKPDHMGYRLNFKAIISALDSTPYLIPREVAVGCYRDQKICAHCPVSTRKQDERGCAVIAIDPYSDSVLNIVGASKATLRPAIMEALRIPDCRVCTFAIDSQALAWDVRLAPQLEIGGEQSGNVSQPAVMVGSEPALNSPYALSGLAYPHPKHQQATLVLDQYAETEDSLSSYKLDTTGLEIFRPASWDDLDAKLDEIYDDLEHNVTGIFGRRDLHLAIDLAYHSPLFLKLGKKTINGWLNLLVIGDSAQGKSETTLSLQKHYGLGEKVECKNATVAGLLGGLQQLGTRWFVSWGVIPTHDRRLVVLEELKGASTEVISKLTDMRSSGIAEIPKIERRRAHARTRLIAISNARGNRPISSYSFGIAAIQELIGGLEDIRRFDFAVLLVSGEVSVEEMRPKKEVEHRFTGELCRRLVLWAWTADVDFDAVVEVDELCEKFSEAMPLVDRGTIRHKIARMAAALAARTFSERDGKIHVRQQHVEYVVALLERTYSSRTFGYLDFSRAKRRSTSIKDATGVRRFLINTKHANHLVSELLYRDDITPQDIGDWCDVAKDDAMGIISFLVRNHALSRRRQWYHKTPDFIALLKRLEGEDLSTKDDPNEEM
jgi:hypothetical protein